MSEIEDARSILRMLLEYPSNLGARELKRLQFDGWRLLAEPADDPAFLEQIKALISKLENSRKRSHGGQLGSHSVYYFKNDALIFERLARGETVKASIIAIYGENDFDRHEKRIKRKKAEIRDFVPLISGDDE